MPKTQKRSAPQGELRALTLFDALPDHHSTFLVDDDGSEPHLRRNEYAVVDTTDRSPAHGELYLVQFSKEGQRHIKQLKADQIHFDDNDEPSLAWWVTDLRGLRQTKERIDGMPIFAGLSEGPYEGDGISSVLIGRIVGYAHSPLGRLFDGKAVRT
jgi:hypothetical protein